MNWVDGRNPAPVDMLNIPLFTGFHTSQVVHHFFHNATQWRSKPAMSICCEDGSGSDSDSESSESSYLAISFPIERYKTHLV